MGKKQTETLMMLSASDISACVRRSAKDSHPEEQEEGDEADGEQRDHGLESKAAAGAVSHVDREIGRNAAYSAVIATERRA